MGKKLKDLVTLECNNSECVVLKVKDDAEMDLICLGCFSGQETLIRLTKGSNHTCTVWSGKGSYSWDWGLGGYTLVSDSMVQKRKLIVDAIVNGFGIYMGEYL